MSLVLEVLRMVKIKPCSMIVHPVIAMASTGALKMLGEKTTVAMARSIAEEYGIQMVLHLDHCTDMALLKRCVDNGFTSVMIDASSKEYQENVDITAEAVEYASKYGCSVEASLWAIPNRATTSRCWPSESGNKNILVTKLK